MRSPVRSTLLLLATAVALFAVRAVVRPYVRAASLIVRTAGLQQQHPTVAALQYDAISESEESVPSRSGPLRARIYTPKTGAERAVILTPGVNALGIDEPRLVAFARNIAASGIRVVTPELPDLSRYSITARSTDMIEDAAAWLCSRRDLSGGRKAGLIGISFAGGLSVVAAGRPALRGRLAFVFSFGGHANFPRVVRYLCSGVGTPAPARYGLPPVRAPHDYGVAVVALGAAHRLAPAEQVEGLRAGILEFLHASHLALFDKPKAEVEFRQARDHEASLPEPARSILHLVNTRDVAALGPKILPFLHELGDEPALSPNESPAPDAPVYLLHGTQDNVVPAAETALLADHLQSRTRVRVLLTPLISHAEMDRSVSSREVWEMVSFWTEMLAE